MAQTKVIGKIASDQKCQTAWATAAANKPEPSNQRKKRQPRQRIGVNWQKF